MLTFSICCITTSAYIYTCAVKLQMDQYENYLKKLFC